MNKKIFTFIIIIIVIMFLYAGCKKEVVDSRKYYDVHKVSESEYEVVLYGSDNDIVEKLSYPKQPYIKLHENQIIEVSISTGNPSRYAIFFEPISEKISKVYFNYLLYEYGKVIYMKDGKLIISDAFDKSVYYKEVSRNYSSTANSSSVVSNVKFLDDNKLLFKYLEGNKYEIKEEIIDL